MFDGIYLFAMLMIATFLVGYILTYRIGEWRRARRPARSFSARSEAIYCASCGKAYTSRRAKTGYDPKTGVALFKYERGCPSADPIRSYMWPNCNVSMGNGYELSAHNHILDETRTSCPVCIDQMLTDGVIEPDVAVKLYGAANALVGSRRD